MKRLSLFLALLVALTITAQAQVTFLFHNGSVAGAGLDIDDAEGSATSTVSGITMTAEAFTDGVSAGTDINGTGTSFGINGSGSDDTDRFDNDDGVESLVFSFDTAGTFDILDLNAVDSGTDNGILSFAGGGTYQLTSVTATSGSDDFAIGESFTAGQLITLTVHVTNATNFGLQSLTITSAVPEPSSFAALAGLAMLGFVGSRRRRALRLA